MSKRKNKKIKPNNILKAATFKLTLSVVLGVAAFFLTKTQIVSAVANSEKYELDLYLLENDLDIDTEVSVRGFRQIKYYYKGIEHKVTDENRPNTDPKTDGEYITWMSQVGSNWQIFLYSITTQKTLQLTTIGNNVNPSISGKDVVWEGQVNGVWQIFLYDGIKIIQLTNGEVPSQHAGVENGFVVYDTKNSENDDWNVFLYDIENQETTQLSQYLPGKNPKISNGTITWTVLVDREALTYKYFVDNQDFSAELNGVTFDEEEYEDFVFSLESSSSAETIPEVQESTESTSSEKTSETPKESSKQPREEDKTSPDTVTAEDIIEELSGTSEILQSTQSVND